MWLLDIFCPAHDEADFYHHNQVTHDTATAGLEPEQTVTLQEPLMDEEQARRRQTAVVSSGGETSVFFLEMRCL